MLTFVIPLFAGETFQVSHNLVPRVLSVFGQRLVARRDSGELEFYYRRISAVKQCKLLSPGQTAHDSR